MSEIVRALAAFAADLRLEDVPATVRERAKHHVLDVVGIAMASTNQDFAAKAAQGCTVFGGGDTPVIGMALRLQPRDAALLNGILCHGLDYDDTHLGGVVHPSASALPCALATAWTAGRSGRDTLLAYLIGVEAASRLGAVAKGGFHQIGFHPTGVVGAFAAALTAGRLLGLDAGQLAHAQGLVLSFASGTLEWLQDGAWNKRLHPGWAAAAGMTAAGLAARGFVGTAAPYDGRFGLYRSYLGNEAGRADLSLATKELGRRWEMMETAIKPFAACHFTHACIDAALRIADRTPAQRIRRVRALVPADVVKTVCEPVANKRRPANSYDAQFSIPFLVAAALTRKRVTLAEIESPALADPAILALAARVDYESDPRSDFPLHYTGEVIAELDDGSVVSHREAINRGAPDRPLTNAEIVEKYRVNAAAVLPEARISAIETAILGIEAGDARALAETLAG